MAAKYKVFSSNARGVLTVNVYVKPPLPHWPGDTCMVDKAGKHIIKTAALRPWLNNHYLACRHSKKSTRFISLEKQSPKFALKSHQLAHRHLQCRCQSLYGADRWIGFTMLYPGYLRQRNLRTMPQLLLRPVSLKSQFAHPGAEGIHKRVISQSNHMPKIRLIHLFY